MIVNDNPYPHIITKGDIYVYNYIVANWNKCMGNIIRETNKFIFSNFKDPIIDNFISDITYEAADLFGIRVQSFADVYYEFKENNEKDKEDGYIGRDIHIDQQEKRVVGIWYFKDPLDTGGDGLYLCDKNRENIIPVPYDSNTLILFKNSPDAWHGMYPRKITPYTRKSVYFYI
jgi:hypothetical protein